MDQNLNSPLVSVVMSCYNSEKYLHESIDSILAQTYTNFELIIWNDGSTDSTEEIIKSYSDSRIKYFSAINQGLGKALNDACKKVQGKYIARMDDDDIALPHRFETQVQFLECNDNCVCVSAAVQYIDNNGAPNGYSIPLLHGKALNKRLSLVHPCSMFRTSAYRKTTGYVQIIGCEDYCLWTQLSDFGKVQNLPIVLLKYRMLPNSLSHKRSSEDPSYNVLRRDLLAKIRKDRSQNMDDIDLFNHICKTASLSRKPIDLESTLVYNHNKKELFVFNVLRSIIGEQKAIRYLSICKTLLINFCN